MMTNYKFTDKAFDKLFNEFDQDKSGKINRQEMTTFIMRIMKTGQPVDAKQIRLSLPPPFTSRNSRQNKHHSHKSNVLMQFDSIFATP